jgi:hypothetical protein
MMDMSFEIVEIAKPITLSNEEDHLIWKYESIGFYSSKHLYVVINFRGGATCLLARCVGLENSL